MFANWINRELIYIKLQWYFRWKWVSKNLIFDKLQYKTNWISEFTCPKKATPNEWYHILQAQNSIKSVINFQKDKFIANGKCIDLSQLSNKYFYNEYINVKFLKPIGINTWLMYLSINRKTKCESALLFHFSLFRRKQGQRKSWCIPSPTNLTQWPWQSIGFQILSRTKYVPSLVKIHWRMLILECSQGCYGRTVALLYPFATSLVRG
jgi:hypothetical protein